MPPLGYDVENRLLVINAEEGAVVRRIFSEMLTIGSPTQIAARLTADGIATKTWTTQQGQKRSGTRIDKKYLHKLLRNRIYLGELSHKGMWYPGAHAPIIDQALWDQVHAVLATSGHARSVETKIANLMIERIDLVDAGDRQGITVKWRELGWDALIGEFAPVGIGAEMLELES